MTDNCHMTGWKFNEGEKFRPTVSLRGLRRLTWVDTLSANALGPLFIHHGLIHILFKLSILKAVFSKNRFYDKWDTTWNSTPVWNYKHLNKLFIREILMFHHLKYEFMDTNTLFGFWIRDWFMRNGRVWINRKPKSKNLVSILVNIRDHT